MIKRDAYLNRIIDKMHDDHIKIITGVRRCGKSYLLKKIYVEYLKSMLILIIEYARDSKLPYLQLSVERSNKASVKTIIKNS